MRSTLAPLPSCRGLDAEPDLPVPPFVLAGDVLISPFPRGRLSPAQQAVIAQVGRHLDAPVIWIRCGDRRDADCPGRSVLDQCQDGDLYDDQGLMRQCASQCASVKRSPPE